MRYYVRPQSLELTSFPCLTLSNMGHELQFSNQLVLLKSYLAYLNLWFLYSWEKNVSDIYRNLRYHQTFALMDTQLWAHHVNLYKQIGEADHEGRDIIVNSFHSYVVFNVLDPSAMCCMYMSQQPYEVGFIFYSRGNTLQMGSQAVLDRVASSHLHCPRNSFPLNPSFISQEEKGFQVIQP